jgi:hypothetical protein
LLRVLRACPLSPLLPRWQQILRPKKRLSGVPLLTGAGAAPTLSWSNLDASYESGEGVPQSDSRPAELYKQGCDGGNEWVCSWIDR